MLISLERLVRLVTTIFTSAGCSEAEAGRIAVYLTRANLAGHDSHGVIRVQRYVEYLQDGRASKDQTVETVLDSDSFAILDGKMGMGQTVGPQSVEIGIAKAKANGVSLIALRNASHLGRIGDFAEIAADAGLISLHFLSIKNSFIVAPFGGSSRRFSTNPVSIGVPTGDQEAPFILDFATSVVAEGKCLVAHQGGKPIPKDTLVDVDGSITDDTFVLYGETPEGQSPNPTKGRGALRAFGEHKGSGLALACELLAGALTGSGTNGMPGSHVHTGMLSIYIDPERFDTEDMFLANVRGFIDWIKQSTPIDPAAGVLIPGEKERLTAVERKAGGIPIPSDTWHSLELAGKAAGLSQAEFDTIAGSNAT